MATLKSNLVTQQEAAKQQQSEGIVHGDDLGGSLLIATAKVGITSALATSDILELFTLPAGAVIVPQLSSVQCSADPATTALVIDIGDTGIDAQPGYAAVTADPDRYADGIVLSNGGNVGFTSTGVPAAAVTPFRPGLPTRVVATVVTATSVLTADLVFTIAYRIKG